MRETMAAAFALRLQSRCVVGFSVSLARVSLDGSRIKKKETARSLIVQR